MANEFEWEEASTTEDFFSQIDTPVGDATSVEEVIEQITKEEDVEVPENPVNEEDLFAEADSSEEAEDPIEEENTVGNISALNLLKERGLIDFELEEGEELTEELADEILEDKYEETIEERIKEKLTTLPEDAQQLIQFVLKGGSVGDFVKSSVGNTSTNISENMDIDEESNQELIIRELLEEEGEDAEFIETQLELLKESGKLKMFAEKKYNKWLKDNKEKRVQLLKDQEERKANVVKAVREAKRKVTSLLSNAEDIGGVEPSKEDRKVLPSFMNDKTIKLQNGAEISEMQKELFYELPKNETAMVQLAILLRNRNADGTFNFDRIANKVRTKVVNNIKQDVRRGKTAIPKSADKKFKAEKSLADYFS